MNLDLRNRFNPVIKEMTKEIDYYSQQYVDTGHEAYLTEYYKMIEKLTKLKQSIKEMETGCVR